MATAMAIGSGRSNPSNPDVSVANLINAAWMSTQKFASGVPTARSLAASASLRVAYVYETSQPTIVIGIPDSNTICAASGSTQMLYSATGVTLPWPRPVPPMTTQVLTFLARDG